MHSYYSKNADKVDWAGIEEAASWIGKQLRKWGRVPVLQTKEKWGQACVYTGFGWSSIHSITHPGHAYIRYTGLINWVYYKTYRPMLWVFRLLNKIVVPYHKWLYSYVYGQALKKWPHLREEILEGADWPELLTKHGLHYIEVGDRSFLRMVDYHPMNWSVRYPTASERITYDQAHEAITIAMHGSGNDNDRYILAMQALGFDPLEKDQNNGSV